MAYSPDTWYAAMGRSELWRRLWSYLYYVLRVMEWTETEILHRYKGELSELSYIAERDRRSTERYLYYALRASES